MKNPELFNEGNQATYCPEDDKLRLYVGRVPREEYEALRAEGWTSTPKQDCDFVAVWTPSREDTALSYAGIILDEDMGPDERAADRAERFSGYRDKRLGEAVAHADRYDSGPAVHGFQSAQRAERAAMRHDRIAGRAVDAWDKAEYWTRRTDGVIRNALYKATPAVRMGRIKTIESELRQAEAVKAEHAKHWRMVSDIAADSEGAISHIMSRYGKERDEAERDVAEVIIGYGKHLNPNNLGAPPAYYFEHQKCDNPPTVADYARHWLATHHNPDTEEWEDSSCARRIRHLGLRLAYEWQMIGEQGGRAATLEMEPGGMIGAHVIASVNKSPKTGRVVSVALIGPATECWQYKTKNVPGTAFSLRTVDTERLPEDAYREPTDGSRAKLAGFLAAKKGAAKERKAKTAPCPLINPTDEDAERLQAVWNSDRENRFDPTPREVARMTQEEYSRHAKGEYAPHRTVELIPGGRLQHRQSSAASVAKVRYYHRRVVILTDKPQKPLPDAVWSAPVAV